MNKEYFNAIKLAGYMFFHVPIERHERSEYIFESDKYYFNDVHICGICGEVVEKWGSKGGVKIHLVEEHPEWIDVHIIFNGYSHNKSKYKMVLDILTNDMVLVGGQCKTNGEYDWYFCLLCGMPQYKDDCLTHMELYHSDWINSVWIIEKREKYVKKQRHTYSLKPWKDPQSLFCSPNLKNIIDKEPLQGDECRDSSRDSN